MCTRIRYYAAPALKAFLHSHWDLNWLVWILRLLTMRQCMTRRLLSSQQQWYIYRVKRPNPGKINTRMDRSTVITHTATNMLLAQPVMRLSDKPPTIPPAPRKNWAIESSITNVSAEAIGNSKSNLVLAQFLFVCLPSPCSTTLIFLYPPLRNAQTLSLGSCRSL